MSKLKKTISRRVTIKDIAALAGVSIGTVDRVLHNRGEVNQETHDRVMSFVTELGYTPNLLAKSLALKKHFSIGVLIPDAGENNPYWKKPLEGFMSAAEELKDFNTKIEIFNYDPGEVKSFLNGFENLRSARPDGIILAPHFHDETIQRINGFKPAATPIMFIDNNLENDKGLAYFGQDAFQSGVVAAKLMHYGLPEGSTVLILNPARNKAITRHMQYREKGFTSYFEKEVPAHKIKTCSEAIDLSINGEPERILGAIFKSSKTISGVFVTNSRIHRIIPALLHFKKQHWIVIGYDLVDENLRLMKEGVIDFLICQKPVEQAYKSAMAMFNYLLTAKKPAKINYSPIDIITRENIDYYN